MTWHRMVVMEAVWKEVVLSVTDEDDYDDDNENTNG